MARAIRATLLITVILTLTSLFAFLSILSPSKSVYFFLITTTATPTEVSSHSRTITHETSPHTRQENVTRLSFPGYDSDAVIRHLHGLENKSSCLHWRQRHLPPSSLFSLVPPRSGCEGLPVGGRDLIFMFILSQFDHAYHRHLIRTTWASYHNDTFVFRFVVALPHAGSQPGYRDLDLSGEQRELEDESSTFGDLIQVNMSDEYRTLTLKHLAALSYQQRHCPQATWVVKGDEDIFLNPGNLQHYLRHQAVPGEDLVCPWLEADPRHPPLPQRSGPWGVTQEEYPFRVYPPFCHGQVYAYRGHLAALIHRLAATIPCHLWLEDVYFSGILAFATGGRHTSLENQSQFKDIPAPGGKASPDWKWLSSERVSRDEKRHSVWYMRAHLDSHDITNYRRQLRILWSKFTKSKLYTDQGE